MIHAGVSLNESGELIEKVRTKTINGKVVDPNGEPIIGASVEKWRREQSVIRTAKWRPDLLEDAELTMKERELAEEIIENREKDLKNEE